MADSSRVNVNLMRASLSTAILFCELARILELAYVSALQFFLFYPNYCPPSSEVLRLARGLGAVFFCRCLLSLVLLLLQLFSLLLLLSFAAGASSSCSFAASFLAAGFFATGFFAAGASSVAHLLRLQASSCNFRRCFFRFYLL